MNETLLLVQPWFSLQGHPAQATLFFARALSGFIPINVLTYVSENNPTQEFVLEQLCEIANTEILRGTQTSLWIGTKVTYQYLSSLLRRRPEIRHVLFIDANIVSLSAALVFNPLPRDCRITTIQLWGHERYITSNFLKTAKKIVLLQVATKYRKLKVAFRTPELAASWRKSNWIVSDACVELPTLELATAEDKKNKSYISERESLIFALAGSLEYRKNIARIAPLFEKGFVPGKLFLAGYLHMELSAIQELIASDSKRIVFTPKFLSEQELYKIVGEAHYSLLLYDADDRHEASMLFTSVRVGTPIIGKKSGWIGRMITEYNLGYVINPYNVDEIQACLCNCALPGSPEYARFQHGINRILQDYRAEVAVPSFLSALGL